MRWGRRAARPVVLLGLAGTVAGCLQAWAIAQLLAGALGGPQAPAQWAALFAVAALVRAATSFIGEARAFEAGAAARRRLRSTVFRRLFAGGPQAMRATPPGETMTLAIDQVEGLDGLFARDRKSVV